MRRFLKYLVRCLPLKGSASLSAASSSSSQLRTTAGHLLLYHDPNVPFPDTTAGKKEKLEKKEKLWRKRWVSADTVMNVYKRVREGRRLGRGNH